MDDKRLAGLVGAWAVELVAEERTALETIMGGSISLRKLLEMFEAFAMPALRFTGGYREAVGTGSRRYRAVFIDPTSASLHPEPFLLDLDTVERRKERLDSIGASAAEEIRALGSWPEQESAGRWTGTLEG